MKTKYAKIGISVVLTALVFVSCSKDPKSEMITETNQESFLEDIKNLKGLTVEESRLLYAFVIRAGMSDALGGEKMSLVGRTVGELIEDQREFEKDLKRQEEEQEKLAAEARIKQEAIAKELRETIQFTVYNKSFRESDTRAGQYDDILIIECAYENKSDKDVRAFTGIVEFKDLFEKDIFKSSVTISDRIPAGHKGMWTGNLEYNQFREDHKQLRFTDLEDMKIVWVPMKILFSDGTQIGESSEGE